VEKIDQQSGEPQAKDLRRVVDWTGKRKKDQKTITKFENSYWMNQLNGKVERGQNCGVKGGFENFKGSIQNAPSQRYVN